MEGGKEGGREAEGRKKENIWENVSVLNIYKHFSNRYS